MKKETQTKHQNKTTTAKSESKNNNIYLFMRVYVCVYFLHFFKLNYVINRSQQIRSYTF